MQRSLMTPWDRYLKVVIWAEARYRNGATLTITINGHPTKFKRIEMAAFDRLKKEVPPYHEPT